MNLLFKVRVVQSHNDVRRAVAEEERHIFSLTHISHADVLFHSHLYDSLSLSVTTVSQIKRLNLFQQCYLQNSLPIPSVDH